MFNLYPQPSTNGCTVRFKLADGQMAEASSLYFDHTNGIVEAVLPNGTRAPLWSAKS